MALPDEYDGGTVWDGEEQVEVPPRYHRLVSEADPPARDVTHLFRSPHPDSLTLFIVAVAGWLVALFLVALWLLTLSGGALL